MLYFWSSDRLNNIPSLTDHKRVFNLIFTTTQLSKSVCIGVINYLILVLLLNHSVAEEDMRQMLVSVSPLTTSVNAVTWQDYTGL